MAPGDAEEAPGGTGVPGAALPAGFTDEAAGAGGRTEAGADDDASVDDAADGELEAPGFAAAVPPDVGVIGFDAGSVDADAG